MIVTAALVLQLAVVNALPASPDTSDTTRAAQPTATSASVIAPIPSFAPLTLTLAPLDTPTKRPRAIEVSDWYNRRLTIHRWASYTMLPLFAVQYELGRNLLYDRHPTQTLRMTHLAVASTVGTLFVVNTVTGVWNLWDSRDATEGRTLRYVHTALMLGSEAGFTATGIAGRHATLTGRGRERHKRIALASIGLSTAGTVLMWIKNF